MLDFLAQRVAISIVTLFLITVIVFTGVRMIPGDPARVLAGTDADEAGLQEIRAKYGLNDPIPLQYFRWITLALQGDLGESIRTREPVVKTVANKLPITIQLAAFSLAIAIGIAIPAGIFSALRQDTWQDRVNMAFMLALFAIPSFVLIPVLRAIMEPAEGVRRRAQLCLEILGEPPSGLDLKVVPSAAQAGSGALPAQEIPSFAISAAGAAISPDELARRLRMGATPVVPRIEAGRVILDFRTVLEGEETTVAAALRAAAAETTETTTGAA